ATGSAAISAANARAYRTPLVCERMDQAEIARQADKRCCRFHRLLRATSVGPTSFLLSAKRATLAAFEAESNVAAGMAKKKSIRGGARREPLDRLAKGLPSSWYHDPRRYARELDVFWYSRWIAAGRDDELPEIGDWRRVSIGTQAIVLLRDEQRALRAFHNT